MRSKLARYTAPLTFTLFGLLILLVLIITGFQMLFTGRTNAIDALDKRWKYFTTPDEPVEKS